MEFRFSIFAYLESMLSLISILPSALIKVNALVHMPVEDLQSRPLYIDLPYLEHASFITWKNTPRSHIFILIV